MQPTIVVMKDDHQRAVRQIEQIPLIASYESLAEQFSQMREHMHANGTLNDSNAKLAEVAKLFCIYLARERGDIAPLPEPAREGGLVRALRSAFAQTAKLPYFRDESGQSIFGQNARLELLEDDEQSARHLFQLVDSALKFSVSHFASGSPFDALNEIFGHFVRDNFRSNTEDAQYMTPPEVVNFMAELALNDLQDIPRGKTPPLLVADPCSGVGSFLATFAHKAKASGVKNFQLFGQDKMPRMVMLSTINLSMLGQSGFHVAAGNSLARNSAISDLNGRVDIILTNPPFGAKFSSTAVAEFGQGNLPFFSQMAGRFSNVDSELLFIDRNLALLREGGLLLMVVPDSVVSGKGLQATLRHNLADRAIPRAIVELPSVTFAQAGTRTKTAIIYLQKKHKEAPRRAVFLTDILDLGFSVASRKGVQLKRLEGQNELAEAITSYKTRKALDTPKTAMVKETKVLKAPSWSPRRFIIEQPKSVALPRFDVEYLPLSDVARVDTRECRLARWQPGCVFIGVIHVMAEGVLDFPRIREYSPKTPGYVVRAGDVLFSRINPRIPRVAVVPALDSPILCSGEFEVLRSDRLDPYELMYLLLSSGAQSQIQRLTSGTSASHNRIRDEDLRRILLPIPKPATKASLELEEIAKAYEVNMLAVSKGLAAITEARAHEHAWLTGG
jgi:type I restriction-modification system DNA methylase subunit